MYQINRTTLGLAALSVFSLPLAAQAPAAPSEAELLEFLREYLVGNERFDIVPADVIPAAHLRNDLGLDSLDTVELIMEVEKHYFMHMPDEDVEEATTIAGLFAAIHKQADQLARPDRVLYTGPMGPVRVGRVYRGGEVLIGLYAATEELEILPPVFRSMRVIENNWHSALVQAGNERDGYWLFDEMGRAVLSDKYRDIAFIEGDRQLLLVRSDDKEIRLFTTSGQPVTFAPGETFESYDRSSQLLKVRTSDGMVGVRQLTGEWREAPSWTDIRFPTRDDTQPFFLFFRAGPENSNERATYRLKNREFIGEDRNFRGIVCFNSRDREYVSFLRRLPAGEFHGETVSVRTEDREWVMVDHTGKLILPSVRGLELGFYNAETRTVAAHYPGGFWRVVDANTGEQLTPARFRYISPFQPSADGVWKCTGYDKNGWKEVIEREVD